MPLYLFEYYDEDKKRHEFQDFLNISDDFNNVKSPCGNFNAKKIISNSIASNYGLTAAEKDKGTTKQRSEYSKFMREQKQIRKKTYAPGTRENNSNEIWTGKEGRDGVTELPIDKKVPEKKKLYDK